MSGIERWNVVGVALDTCCVVAVSATLLTFGGYALLGSNLHP